MPGEGLNADFQQIGSEQKRLESVRTGRESPQLVKAEVQKYRATYMNEVNGQKATLQSFFATAKSDQAKEFLPKAMKELSGKMAGLAQEGESLQASAIAKKKEKGEPLTKEDLNFASLASMKAALSDEMGREKAEVAGLKQMEVYITFYNRIEKANIAIDAASSLGALSTNIAKKNQLSTSIKANLTKVESINLSGSISAASLKTQVIEELQALDSDISDDIEKGNQAIAIKTKLTQENAELSKLEEGLPGKDKQLTAEEYSNYLAQLKERNNAILPQYTAFKDILNIQDAPFLNNLLAPFYKDVYQPVVDKLQDLHVKVDQKKPKDESVEKPDEELTNTLEIAKARQKFAEKNKYLQDIVKDLKAMSKIDKVFYDRSLLKKNRALIEKQPSEVEKLFNESNIGNLILHENENVKTQANEIYDAYYEPTRRLAEQLIHACDDQESKIEEYEKKVVNEKFAEILVKMEGTWTGKIEANAAKFLGKPLNPDENSAEYKSHVEGESALFGDLVACESQVNFALCKQGEGMTPENKAAFESYRSKIHAYKDKIISNRAFRKSLLAGREEQDQTHEYKVKTGTRPATRPKGDSVMGKPIMEEYQEDVFEKRSDTYKFSECVEFIDPNNPDFAKINGGKGWRFTKSDLPKDVQDKFTIQAGKIITDTQEIAEKETKKEERKLITENKLFDLTREELGEQADDYFKATELLAEGDIPGAKAAYERYIAVSESFSAEEKQKHAEYIAEAKHEVRAFQKCVGFYEAASLSTANPPDLDAAINKYREFLKGLSREDQKQFAEQVSIAKEQMKRFNGAKLAILKDLKEDLVFLACLNVAREGGTSRADADNPTNYAQLKGYRREVMLPYIPYNLLTQEEKFRVSAGEGGLQGQEIKTLEAVLGALEKKVKRGDPIVFEEEIGKIKQIMKGFYKPTPGGNTFIDPDTGERRMDVPSARLFTLFEKINSTDPKEREEGCISIAQRFKDEKTGMRYTQKWLRRAMMSQYDEYRGTEDGKKLHEATMKKLKGNSQLAANIQRGALKQWQRWAEEQNRNLSPGEEKIPLEPPDPMVLQSFQTIIFRKTFETEYEKEMRQKLTEKGKAADGSALDLYNTSMPYDQATKTWSSMYKPWQWSSLNEDDWNTVKDELTEFAVETIVTLPIGMGAGAVGKSIGSVALKALMRQGMKAEAIALIEKGGIRALMASSKVWKGVAPELKQVIMAQRGRILAGWTAGLAAEGSAMMLMNSVWEGLSTGRNPEFFDYLDKGKWGKATLSMLESIAKAGTYRAFGASQNRLTEALAGTGTGALKRAGVHIAGETFSGFAGTGLEALSLIAKGKGDQVTMDFWVRSIVQNTLQSGGTHIAHSGVLSTRPRILDYGQRDRTQKAINEVNSVRLDQVGVKRAEDIKSARLLPSGGLEINGYTIPAGKLPMGELPASIRDRIQTKTREAAQIEVKSMLNAAGIADPAQFITLRDKVLISADGQKIPIADPSMLPASFQMRYQELQRFEVQRKVHELEPIETLLAKRTQAEKTGDTELLAGLDKQIATKAAERNMSPEVYMAHMSQEIHLTRALAGVYENESHLYHETKVINKPLLDKNGVQLKAADDTLLFERVNLFENFETKASAYSQDMLNSLTHEELSKHGGTKIIKIGGDELVVYHAGPDGKVQKLFIDISNMGPTNSTATNIAGSKVNLVDIYLHKISEQIAAQSKSSQGKLLDPNQFNANVNNVANSLFSLDKGQDGRPIPEAEARARFKKLKAEWNLEGTFETYMTDVQSMRALAEYRADTRYLDASYKKNQDVSFTEHIASEIQTISGHSLPDLQKMIASNPDLFKKLFAERLPKSTKLAAPSAESILAEIAKLDPKTSKPEDMMMLYGMMARIDLSTINTDARFKPLADSLAKNRQEMVGDPPHPRVEAARLMDAKVVSIEIPPELTKALSAMAKTDPVKAQAILTAARKFAEIPLDNLKYEGPGKFAKYNIMDFVEVIDGKVRIKPEAQEFRQEVMANLQDKKVSNIVEMERSLTKAREKLEALYSQHEQGLVPQDVFDRETRAVEAEMSKIEDRLSKDPDTGAYSQSYLDVRPTRMYSFEGTTVDPQYRIWDSVVTELGHAGVINSKYGYLGMDQIMAGYHDILQANIAKALPPELQHFKIIRKGGGAFEVVFLDARAVDYLAKTKKTPASLIAGIASKAGQQMVDQTLQKSPDALAKAQTDAAVRNSQFKYGKGSEQIFVGQLLVSSETTINPDSIARLQAKKPKASVRELIGKILSQEPDSQRPIRMKKGAEGEPVTVEAAGPPSDSSISPERIPGTSITRELFESGFSTKPPDNLHADSPAWIDEDGRVFYNVDHFNPKAQPDGTVIPSPFLAEGYEMFHDTDGQPRIALMNELRAEGYSLVRNKDGTITLQHPQGKKPDPISILSIRGYHRKMRGTPQEKVLIREMRRLKSHEQMHRMATLMPDLMGILGKRDSAGNLPEGKIELVDASGKPMELTHENAEEYISDVADGTIKDTSGIVDPETGQTKLESHIGEQLGLPGFRFKDISRIDTKLLASNPREAFRRARAAAKGSDMPAGEAWKTVRSPEDFTKALAAEKGRKPDDRIAHQIMRDMMWLLRSGDQAQIDSYIMEKSIYVEEKVLRQFQSELLSTREKIAKRMLDSQESRLLAIEESKGELSPIATETYNRMKEERRIISEQLSNTTDNKPKSPARKKADIVELRRLIDQKLIDLNDVNVRTLSQNPDGLRILAERPGGIELVLDRFPDTNVEPLITEVLTQKPLEYTRLSREYANAKQKGAEALEAFYRTQSPENQKVVFAVEAEARITGNLLSENMSDGKPKSAEQKRKDTMEVNKRILAGTTGIGRRNLEEMSRTIEGRRILKNISQGKHEIAGRLKIATVEMYKDRIVSIHSSRLTQEHLLRVMKGDLTIDRLSILARDTEKRLTPSQIARLIDTRIASERIKTMEANIDHPEVTPALLEKMLTAPPILTEVGGKMTRFYDAEFVGEGAQGRVFKAAVIKPDGRFEFIGCKVNKDETPQPTESQTAKLMQTLKDRGIDSTHLMDYRGVSDDGKYVFLKLYEYTDPAGQRYRMDIDGLLKLPDSAEEDAAYKSPDPVLILKTVLGGGEALAALETVGMINPDSNLSQYVPATGPDGQPIGIHIDLGNVLNADVFRSRQMVPESQISGEYNLGRPPEGVGVTGGYFNQALFERIQRGEVPPQKHHNYTFGVAIKALLTGHITLQKITPEGPVSEFVPSNRPIKISSPPFAPDAGERLFQLSTELMNPDSTITMQQAVDKMKEIIKTIPPQTQ